MRRILALAVVFGVSTSLASPAGAQLGLIPIHLGIGGGVTLPLGDFGNSFNSGFNVLGTIAITPPLVPIGFRGDVAYNQFSAKGGASNVKAKVASVSANAVWGLPGVIITPYLIGGVGYYRLSSSLTGSSASNRGGFNVGGGLNLGLLAFKAFAEARYTLVATANGSTTFVPITVGVMF